MDKQAYLEETYNLAFNDELEKVAKARGVRKLFRKHFLSDLEDIKGKNFLREKLMGSSRVKKPYEAAVNDYVDTVRRYRRANKPVNLTKASKSRYEGLKDIKKKSLGSGSAELYRKFKIPLSNY